MRDLSQIAHVQPAGKIAPRIGEHGLNPVRFWSTSRRENFDWPPARRWYSTSLRDSAGRFKAEILFEQRKRKIDASGHVGRSPHRYVSGEHPVLFDPHLGPMIEEARASWCVEEKAAALPRFHVGSRIKALWRGIFSDHLPGAIIRPRLVRRRSATIRPEKPAAGVRRIWGAPHAR